MAKLDDGAGSHQYCYLDAQATRCMRSMAEAVGQSRPKVSIANLRIRHNNDEDALRQMAVAGQVAAGGRWQMTEAVNGRWQMTGRWQMAWQITKGHLSGILGTSL
jgi:hypothetical protein